MSETKDLHAAFAADLKDVCDKHGATFVSIAATMPDGTFYGACMVESLSMANPMQQVECTFGVARLWQHCREAVRTMLDRAERGWK